MFALTWLIPFSLGAAIGLSKVFVPRLPKTAAWLVVLAYIVFLVWFVIWAKNCDCLIGEDPAIDFLPIMELFGGSYFASGLAGIGTGVVLADRLRPL